jgi:WhiB family redox-sensing transcriptional regulator
VKIVAQGDELLKMSTRSMITGQRRDTDRTIDLKEQGTMDWRNHAACRDEDPELFFPVGTSGPALLQIAEAKAVCRRCPVSSECLNWALASGQDAGVWGGLSEDDRRALKRRNAGTGTRIDAGA